MFTTKLVKGYIDAYSNNTIDVHVNKTIESMEEKGYMFVDIKPLQTTESGLSSILIIFKRSNYLLNENKR